MNGYTVVSGKKSDIARKAGFINSGKSVTIVMKFFDDINNNHAPVFKYCVNKDNAIT